MTVFGGLWGGGIAAALAFLFYGLALILVSFAPAEFGVDKTPFIVGQLIRLVVLPTCIGIAEGALLMAVATALLQRYGRLLWTTSLGAIVGALVGPGLIGFLVVLPAVLAQTSAPDHSARFVLCLVAAAIGAPLGMAAMFVLTAAVMAIETTQKPNA